jgi:hypothetical protein
MGKRDPRVDAYIERQAEFARPILTRLRATVRAACPEAEETLKWGMPAFMYHGILCGIAGFKHHCALWFRQRELVVRERGTEPAMGQFGRITRLADLPPRRVIAGYVKQAMALNALKTPKPVARGAKTARKVTRVRRAGSTPAR